MLTFALVEIVAKKILKDAGLANNPGYSINKSKHIRNLGLQQLCIQK
jgi:hypothetical protein